MINIKPFILGTATYIPGLSTLVWKFRGKQGATHSARYCYAVWMRHLVLGAANGFSDQIKTVAEIGPGPSLGTGLAALLSGANRYYALDFVPYASTKMNLIVFDGLVELFQQRAPIPAENEFPAIKPALDSYAFPDHILSEDLLRKTLHSERLAMLRHELETLKPGVSDGSYIFYFAPWYTLPVVFDETLNMIYSQAVLEHVDELAHLYKMCYSWLKPGGFMSHQIDFQSHGTAHTWNGHWTYSNYTWRLFIRGKRSFLLNREPHSSHIHLMRQNGFDIVCNRPVQQASPISRQQLAAAFQYLTDDDLITRGAFVQAVKRDTCAY